MAKYAREEDMKVGNVFYYCNERDKGIPSTYQYGHAYEIVKVHGGQTDMTIRVKLLNGTSRGSILTDSDFFCAFFVILTDEEEFTLQLCGDTERAGIVMENEPLPPKSMLAYIEKKKKYDGK